MLIKICILTVALVVACQGAGISLRGLNNPDYYFSSLPVSFPQAWAYCKKQGLKFLSITSQAQNRELEKALDAFGADSQSFWIGGIYLRNGFLKKWYWVDSDEQFAYANFNRSPVMSSSSDYCITFEYSAVTQSGNWSTSFCQYTRYFICHR